MPFIFAVQVLNLEVGLALLRIHGDRAHLFRIHMDGGDVPGALLVGDGSVLLEYLDDVETVGDNFVAAHGGAHRVTNHTAVVDDDDRIAADTLFFVEAIIETGHAARGVGQKRDGQVSGKPIVISGCINPGLVTLGAVCGAGDHLTLELLKLVDLLVELDELIAATVVLGVEDDDEVFAAVVSYANVTDITTDHGLHGEPRGSPGHGER